MSSSPSCGSCTMTPTLRVSECSRDPIRAAGTHSADQTQSRTVLLAAQPTTAISPVGVNKSRALEVEPELTCLVTLELRLRDRDVPQSRPSVGDRDPGLEPRSEKAVPQPTSRTSPRCSAAMARSHG